MQLRSLVEGVTFYGRFADVVNAYERESQFKRARVGPTFIFGKPPSEGYPLDVYGDVLISADGLLMTKNAGVKYLIQKVMHGRRNITPDDLEKLEKSGIYFKPTLLRSADGVINWQRSDTDF